MQFKRFKTSKDEHKIEPKFEPKVEPKIEPKPVVPKVEIQNKSVEEDWYKAALARAKQIAQNMSVPPAPTSTALVKPEPVAEGTSTKLDPNISGNN